MRPPACAPAIWYALAMLEKAVVLACCLLAACLAQESAPASKPESRIEFRLDERPARAPRLGRPGGRVRSHPGNSWRRNPRRARGGPAPRAHQRAHAVLRIEDRLSRARARREVVRRWARERRDARPTSCTSTSVRRRRPSESAFAAQQTRFFAANIDASILERRETDGSERGHGPRVQPDGDEGRTRQVRMVRVRAGRHPWKERRSPSERAPTRSRRRT